MIIYHSDNRVDPYEYKKKLNRVAKIGDIAISNGWICHIKVRGGWEPIRKDQIPFFEKLYGKAVEKELFPNLDPKDNVLIRIPKRKK